MASRKRSATGELVDTCPAPAFIQRSASLLSSLRTDGTFSDAEVLVDEECFPVHRSVVCALSPFFFKSFSGPFQEADKRKLKLKDTSSAAVSVLLDYAYCMDVEGHLKSNFKLALDVVQLAHRLEVMSLMETAARAAQSQVTLNTCLSLYLTLKFYGAGQCQEVLQFIAQRLEKVSCTRQFREVAIDDLEKFVSSKYVVASEMQVYKAVKNWLVHHKNLLQTERVCDVFSHVYFELFSADEISNIMAERDFIPKKALLKSIQRRTIIRPDLPAMGAADLSWRGGNPTTTGALVVPKAAQGVPASSGKHVFKLCNFVMSAEVVRDRNISVVVKVIRRESTAKLDVNVEDEFQRNGFKIIFQLMKGTNGERMSLDVEHPLTLEDVHSGKKFSLERCADMLSRWREEISVVFHITKDAGRGRYPSLFQDPYAPLFSIYARGRGFGRRSGRGGGVGRGRGRGGAHGGGGVDRGAFDNLNNGQALNVYQEYSEDDYW